MSEQHYSSLDEFVGALQKQGFKREQIRNIADSIDVPQSSYGNQAFSDKGIFIGSLVTGGIVGGLTCAGCAFVNALNSSEPGFISYLLSAMTFVMSAAGISNANFETRNEENEKLYQHLKDKFPQVANKIESVAKARHDTLERKLYSPALTNS